MPLTLPHLGFIETEYDPKLAETLRQIMQHVNVIGSKAGVDGAATQAPPNVRSISVTAANGYFNIVLTDPDGMAQPSLGIHYFVDWDLTAAFLNPQTINLLAARNWYGALGSQTLYFRAYSQYRNSPRSAFLVYGGSSPIGVVGGGSAGPTPAPSNGSGGAGGGGGFGGGK